MYSLTENYDPELYNIHFKKRVFDNYGVTIQFSPSYRVNTPLWCAFHKILALNILQQI